MNGARTCISMSWPPLAGDEWGTKKLNHRLDVAPRDNYTIQADRVLSAERGSRSYSSMSFNGIYPRSMDCSNPKTDYFADDVERWRLNRFHNNNKTQKEPDATSTRWIEQLLFVLGLRLAAGSLTYWPSNRHNRHPRRPRMATRTRNWEFVDGSEKFCTRFSDTDRSLMFAAALDPIDRSTLHLHSIPLLRCSIATPNCNI